MKLEYFVYIYDEHDNELEVDMELLEEGYSYGVVTGDGEEIKLSPEQEQKARDQYRENLEEYEAAKADYYYDY